jgi:DNA-binding beta-propeller fold protein YncE
LATGLEARGWPLGVAEWRNNFMHGGFTYNPANGLLYGVTSSPCDISPWYGRIFVIDTNVPALVHKFFPMSGNAQQGTSGGGIWGPGGAAIDAATNHVFIATGNADTHLGREKQNAPYAEQIIELSPRLDAILANNYPTNIPMNGMNDFDFGATPLLFRPPGCPPLLAALNKSGMFELYDRKTISNGPIQYIAMAVPSNTGSFIGTPAYDPETGYVYVGLPSTESIYHPGMAAFSMASNCTLNPTPVWSAKFGPEGDSRTPAPRSPISIANGVVYISNYTGETEYAFDAATGAKLWRLRLPFYGRQGTVIADGLVFVSSSEGTISAWATGPDAQRLRKRAVQRNVPVGSPDVSIPDGMGGTIDLRTSFNALANFGQQL